MRFMKATVCEKTIAWGKNRYRVDTKGNWQCLVFGSHSPNDPPVGLSWKWISIPENKVPDEVKKIGYA
jgi:hypothetical protein